MLILPAENLSVYNPCVPIVQFGRVDVTFYFAPPYPSIWKYRVLSVRTLTARAISSTDKHIHNLPSEMARISSSWCLGVLCLVCSSLNASLVEQKLSTNQSPCFAE